MKKLLVLLMMLWVSNLAAFPRDKMHVTAFFGDKVNVRESPSVKAKVVKNCRIGSPLKVLKKMAKYEEFGGFVDHWYKVKIGNTIGYVWGGLLSDATFSLGNGYQIVVRNFSEGGYNIPPKKYKNHWNVSPDARPELIVRLVKNFKYRELDTNYPGESYVHIANSFRLGKYIYFKMRVSFYGETTGSRDYYCYYDNNNFHVALTSTSDSEGGYTVKSKIKFKIIKGRIIAEEMIKNIQSGDKINIEEYTLIHNWNNAKKVFVKGAKIKLKKYSE